MKATRRANSHSTWASFPSYPPPSEPRRTLEAQESLVSTPQRNGAAVQETQGLSPPLQPLRQTRSCVYRLYLLCARHRGIALVLTDPRAALAISSPNPRPAPVMSQTFLSVIAGLPFLVSCSPRTRPITSSHYTRGKSLSLKDPSRSLPILVYSALGVRAWGTSSVSVQVTSIESIT